MLLSFVSSPGVARPLLLIKPDSTEAVSEVDDAALVARCLNGERGAMDLLYRRYAPLVVGRATRLLARSAEAEDVTQDAFVQAFRDLRKLREPERFASWLMAIVMHQAQRRFRRRRLLQRLGFGGVNDAGLEQLVDPSAGPELRAQCAQLDRALQRLSSQQRIVWVLRFVESCSLGDIAEYQRCSLATVKRQLGSASAAIREYVEFELPGEDDSDAITPSPFRGDAHHE